MSIVNRCNKIQFIRTKITAIVLLRTDSKKRNYNRKCYNRKSGNCCLHFEICIHHLWVLFSCIPIETNRQWILLKFNIFCIRFMSIVTNLRCSLSRLRYKLWTLNFLRSSQLLKESSHFINIYRNEWLNRWMR